MTEGHAVDAEPGKLYRDAAGAWARVVCLATHAKTRQTLVVCEVGAGLGECVAFDLAAWDRRFKPAEAP